MDQNSKSTLPASDSANEKAAIAAKLHDGEIARHSVTINKSPEEVYSFFREFKNLPSFMMDLVDIQVLSPTRTHWVMRLQHGPKRTAEWDAEIIAERFGEMISWHSIGDSDVHQAGSVWFSKAPENLGTIVRLSISYLIPYGRLSELTTKLYGEDPDTIMLTNLRRLKALLETGEIPTIEGQPSSHEDIPVPFVTH